MRIGAAVPPRTLCAMGLECSQGGGDVAVTSVEVHSAKRWGVLVGFALKSLHDVPTVSAWSREVGMSETQLRLRCRLAGVTAKTSLDLVRVLRAVICREARGGALNDYLDVGDTRTLRRLFIRVGLREGCTTTSSRANKPFKTSH
jgi:hypothetical protein